MRVRKGQAKKPFEMRGWQLPLKWKVIARRGEFGTPSYQKIERTATSREEAYEAADVFLREGWKSVELRSEEQLHPRRVA